MIGSSTPELQRLDPLLLVRLFYSDTTEFGRLSPCSAHQLPRAAQRLLVHHEHMTEAMEAFHGQPVELEVLQQRADQDWYAREIVLRLATSQRVVQMGIVRIFWRAIQPSVRAEIQKEQTPLGRLLRERAGPPGRAIGTAVGVPARRRPCPCPGELPRSHDVWQDRPHLRARAARYRASGNCGLS